MFWKSRDMIKYLMMRIIIHISLSKYSSDEHIKTFVGQIVYW